MTATYDSTASPIQTVNKVSRRGRVLVVGCGRWCHGDDEAGLRAAAALQKMWLPGAEVILTESPLADIVSHLDGTSLLIILDAAREDGRHRAGDWIRIDSTPIRPGIMSQTAVDTHSLSVDAALALAAELRLLPPRVWIYAMFAGRFGPCEGLSEAAQKGVESVIREVAREVHEWVAEAGHA